MRDVSLLSWTTGSFVSPTVASVAAGGEAAPIEDASIGAAAAHAAFSAAWAAEVAGAAARPPSLVRALWATFSREMLLAALAKAGWGAGIVLSASLFVRALLAHVNARAKDTVRVEDKEAPGYLWASFFFVTTVILSLSLQQMNAISARCVRARAARRVHGAAQGGAGTGLPPGRRGALCPPRDATPTVRPPTPRPGSPTLTALAAAAAPHCPPRRPAPSAPPPRRAPPPRHPAAPPRRRTASGCASSLRA